MDSDICTQKPSPLFVQPLPRLHDSNVNIWRRQDFKLYTIGIDSGEKEKQIISNGMIEIPTLEGLQTECNSFVR